MSSYNTLQNFSINEALKLVQWLYDPYMQSLGSANEITQIPVGSRSHEKTQEMTVTHSAILNDACIQTIYFLGMFMEFSQFGMITG